MVDQTINLISGLTGTIITDMPQYAMKEEDVNDNLKNHYAKVKMLRGEIFEGKKKVTSGILFKSSQLGLDSNVLNFQERKERIVFDTSDLERLKAVEEHIMWKVAAL